MRARFSNSLIAAIAISVSCIGRVEKLLNLGADGMKVEDIREATLQEVRQGAGALSDSRLLPSAYEVWIGTRTDGRLRLRTCRSVHSIRHRS